MKILLTNIAAYPCIGGVENSLIYIGRELMRIGHDVKVFCFQHSPDEPLSMVHEGVEIIRSPYKPFRWPHTRLWNQVATAQQAIPAVLEKFRPDLIWSRSASVGLGIRRSGYQGPLVQVFCTNAKMDCRGLYLQTHGLPLRRRLMFAGLWSFAYTAAFRLERELASNCTAVAFSENMRRQLHAGFPRRARHCHVIPPGIDGNFFSPENGARHFSAIRREYGLHPDEPIVLYVGRLLSAKHIPMLMDAVAALATPAKLVLVGGGPDEALLRQYAHRVGISNRVVFCGPHQTLLPGFYAMARVFVLPTTTESFGLVYLEALACGTPAVGFTGDGHRVLTATDEIVRDGMTGGIARRANASALADKIGDILSLNNSSYDAMSQNARKDVLARFSWVHFVDKTLSLTLQQAPGCRIHYD